MNKLKFESYKVAHNLPEVPLTTWTFHPTIDGVRKSMVAVLIPTGQLFVGTADWLPSVDRYGYKVHRHGWSPRKHAFNRAYGKATQKLSKFLRGQSDVGAIEDVLKKDAKEVSALVKQYVLG